jgi:molybdopterin/thiamine biosynthesis adenylyltransferase
MTVEALSLESMARRVSRSGQKMLMVGDAELRAWAHGHALSLRQAFEAALQAGIFPECFERNFPSLSAAEQLRLFQSSALVVGLGGLGGTLAALLARVGVGRLLLADGDVFAPSNLNRQFLATQETLGRNKAQVAAEHILSINPALSVEAIPHFLDQQSLPEPLAQVQIVLDGLDNLKTRRDLFATAETARVPLIHGAVMGTYGQVSTVLPTDRESFDRIFSTALDKGEPPDILAPLPTLIASLQVQEAVRLLLGKTPAYHNLLAYFDGDTGRLEMLPLE